MLNLLPIAHAATYPLLQNIKAQIINPLIAFMVAIGLVVFIYGVVEMIQGADSEEKRSEGRQHMIWGVIGLFVMVAVIGILNVVIDTISSLR